MPTPNSRTPALRQRCLERKHLTVPLDGDPRLAWRSLQASEGVPSWRLRRAYLTRDLLAGLPLALDDLELLLGRLAPDRPEWQAERAQARAWLQQAHPHLCTPGQTGHCQLDLSRLFALGLDGLREALLERSRQSTVDQAETYQAFALALEGLSALAENAAALAEAAVQEADQGRAGELSEMAAICRRIAHQPPESFRAALQLAWLAILGCHFGDRAWLVSPGHLDRYLWPYYQADLAAGWITADLALELLEGLYLLLNEVIPDGLAISVMVGGRDATGQDLTNPLSHLCLEALRRTRLVYPTVGVCWHPGTPAALTGLAIELIAQGCANPAFFNDQTIQRGLQLYGVPPEESWDYVNSTCVEITPCGSSNVWVASPYFSLCQVLLEEIDAQAQASAAAPGSRQMDGQQGVATTFEAFLAAYRARLAGRIAAAVAEANEQRRQRRASGGKPLQSVFTRDCLERGLDIDCGGARYNWVECSFVGLANLADSLYVLQEEVYRQRRLSLAQLQRILALDFAGYEAERLRFLNAYPKYGNDQPEVDRLAGELVETFRQECTPHRVEPDGSPFVPGAFCWIMHEQLGRACGATPDGRRAGFPFADGCGAAQGREAAGPTAAACSVTSWDAAPLIGGAAFNLKFGASIFRAAEARRHLHDLVVTFLRRGGFETQINVVDSQVLRAAQADPEAYRDLVVRIGGYTDYFTRLTPEMQAEVIQRTEYAGC
jgi:pyruvate-formate lyase